MKDGIHSKKAREYGIDTSLIESNLKLSYTERIIQLQKALDLFFILKSAGKKYYAKLRKDTEKLNKK